MNRICEKEDNMKSALIHVYNYTNCTFVNTVSVKKTALPHRSNLAEGTI